MEAACDRYLDHLRIERNLSPRTIEAYSRDLRELRQYLAARGAHEPDQVTHGLLSGWLQSLAARGLSPTSQSRALSATRQLFGFLLREQVLRHNPTQALQGPRRARPLPVVPSVDETNRLLAAPKPDSPRGLRDRAALELLYASGLRASELCLLRLDELQLGEGLVRPRGKGSKERLVPLGEPARQTLEAYLAHGRPALLKGAISPYVFIGNRARPLSRMALFKVVRRYSLAAGNPQPLSPHALRHAFATHLLQGGADLRAVQELLGHASVSTTEIYTHVLPDALQETVQQHHPLGAGRPGRPRE